MTPKEKAKDIYCKYADALNIRDLQTDHNPFAELCALIAVDEIIDTFIPKTKPDFTCYEIEYWKEVKKEIELL